MPSASLDPAEVAKFSKLAAEWWDPKGAFAPLHALNPARLEIIRDEARARAAAPAGAKPLAGLSILDIGCGGGLVSVPLTRLGARVTGLDASQEAIAAARLYAEEAGLAIEYRAGTVEALADELADKFDLVLALEIVEHVADVATFLGACAALVRPGGKLIVSTLNRTHKARALAVFAAERILHWAPIGTHDYEKFVTPEELAYAAPDLDWQEPVGLRFDPLSRQWRRSKDVDVNYVRVARKREEKTRVTRSSRS